MKNKSKAENTVLPPNTETENIPRQDLPDIPSMESIGKFQSIIKKIIAPVKKIGDKLCQKHILKNFLLWFLLSAVLVFVLEILNRQSLIQTLAFTVLRLHMFLINTALVMLFTSPMLLAKRKFFAFAIPGCLLLSLGVINTVLLNIKHMPFAATDLLLVQDAVAIFTKYVNNFYFALIIVSLIAITALMILLFKKGKKFKTDSRKDLKLFVPSFITLIAAAIIITVFDFFPIQTSETTGELFRRNGFTYSFFKSAGPTGVKKPSGYSYSETDDLRNQLLEVESANLEDKPNIIVLQLESFFDMNQMVNSNNPNTIHLSSDPVPNFRKLIAEYPSGYLTVPSFGGGTSNVEFEVLTGMSLQYFQIGESPYQTHLSKNALPDSTPYNMKTLGYRTHAIHNYTATFYERRIAYKNMGFDSFTPLEYMNNITYNSLGWPKDDVLPGEIMKALNASEEKDFIFTVSVQGHGQYPTSFKNDEFDEIINADAKEYGANTKEGLTFYASTIKEMDDMLGKLVSLLENYDEKCMLVVYGDHLPALDFSVNWISAPSSYTSQYAIWTNYEIAANDRDLTSYQLMAHVQSLIGASEGVLVNYHQQHSNDVDYQENLHSLEYLLTSEEHAQKGTIQYASYPIIIDSVTADENTVTVKGENFTPYSKISYDGTNLVTVFVSPFELTAVSDLKNIKTENIYISQMAKDEETILATVKQ